MTDSRWITWGELDPGTIWSDDPVLNPHGVTSSTVVDVGDHHLYRYDHAKALRCMERFAELGGHHFIVSKDIGDMKLRDGGIAFFEHGVEIKTDRTLPDNSILIVHEPTDDPDDDLEAEVPDVREDPVPE